jgi:molybdopterin/thiamine biosynthesis adenylyltransferase
MACVLGFQELASRNPFVKDLDDLGYDLDFIGGYFVIFGLPYLDKGGALQHGDLVCKVALTEEGIINPPTGDHQAWFRGEQPYHESGEALKIGFAQNRLEVTPGFEAPYSFSFKLNENGQMRDYSSFAEKVETYLHAITAPAIAKYPDATPLRGIEKKAAAQNTPLRYPDTSSANYGLNDISGLLRGKKIAIVGLGGTGSYILDLLARTHLERIVLFDDDKVHVHTIFRMPGFIPRAIGKGKVEALVQQYGHWHSGIEPVRERITQENIERLGTFDFVFVSVDDGSARRLIVDWLSSKGIPFIDCGMGLNRSAIGLNGMVRITGVDRAAYDRTIGTAYLPTMYAKEDEYRRQAQIAELNALNATLAVIRFKQYFKLLDRVDESAWYTLEAASLTIDSERP